MNQLIAQLAQDIENEYQKNYYKESTFNEIAFNQLERYDLCYEDIQQGLLNSFIDSIDLQVNNREQFCDLPIILFENSRFRIQLLTWLNASTVIHEHGFYGAFQVVRGSSIERVYRYNEHQEINSKVKIGELEPISFNHRTAGSKVKINGGSDYIHSLYHLEEPTITLIIRTHSLTHLAPQLSYYPNGLALDSWAESKKSDFLKSISHRDSAGILLRSPEHVRKLLTVCPVNQLVGLCASFTEEVDSVIRDYLCESFEPSVAKCFEGAIQHIRQDSRFVELRQTIKNRNYRALLAALRFCKNREEFEHFVFEELKIENYYQHITMVVLLLIENNALQIDSVKLTEQNKPEVADIIYCTITLEAFPQGYQFTELSDQQRTSLISTIKSEAILQRLFQ